MADTPPVIVEPTLILGPAVVEHNGMTYYTEGNITEKLVRETQDFSMAHVGKFDKRLKSQHLEISFTPAGELKNASKFFPYAPADIGQNIYALATTDPTVTIWTKAGQQIIYAAGAVAKSPSIHLGVNKPWLGEMTLRVKGNPTKQLTAAAAWNAVSAVAFDDASFDDTLIKTGRYTANWGAGQTAILTGAGSQDGFQIDHEYTLEAKAPDGWNELACLLAGMVTRVRFKPIDWTEADFYDYLRLQGATAILPGESLAKMLKDMTIASGQTGLSICVNKVGPMDGQQLYGLKDYRQGEVGFEGRITWTTGVVDPALTITIT